MKRTIFTLALLCVFGIFEVAAQCPRDVLKMGRQKAEKAAFQTMKEISPNTGENSDFELTSCRYDELNGRVVFDVELTWSAKSCWLCFDRQQCKVWGEIRISEDNPRDTKFIKEGMTSFTIKCVNSRKWDILEGAINAAMNSAGN